MNFSNVKLHNALNQLTLKGIALSGSRYYLRQQTNVLADDLKILSSLTH